MKIPIYTFLLITFLFHTGLCDESPSSWKPGQIRDIQLRILDFDPEGYQMAIEDLSASFSSQFQPGDGWKRLCQEISTQKQKIHSGHDLNEEEAEKIQDIFKSLDDVLIDNPLVRGKKILAIKRYFPARGRSVMSAALGLAPSNFQNNSEIANPSTQWHNEYALIKKNKNTFQEEMIFQPPRGLIVSDTEPHWSGEKFMYSSIGSHNRWHLFEFDLRTNTARQLTPESYEEFDSFDGCYSPDGLYIFCSTATFLGLPCTNGGNKMCGLFSYDPSTGQSRQLTFDQDSNWNPVIMNNGLVLYQRWEYADLPHSNSRFLFSMNPDGTSQQAYYGSNSYFPTAFFGARPIPGKPHMVAGIAGGHHSVSRSGQLLIIDTAKGTKEADGVVAEIPFRGKQVLSEVRDRLPDGKWPQFLHPYPLSEKYFLVSMKRSPQSLWGLYLVDIFNNMVLISEEEDCAYLEPCLMEAVAPPPVIPSRVKQGEKNGTVFLQDVYFGGGLKGIPKGEVKKLRIGSYSFSPLKQGGLLGTIGLDGPWDVKRILGEVDVEEDGSAMFTVPANTPIFVQPLDRDGKALQVMRSWFTVMPGENLSCVGCHENRHDPVTPRQAIASRKAPQDITPFYHKPRGLSFVHEIQPILDRACAGCHHDSQKDIPCLAGEKSLEDWSSEISGKGHPSYAGKFTESYYQLQRYVRRPGIESDMDMLVPMDVHPDQTELFQILNKGHHGVVLTREEQEKLACWVDLNAPFVGRRSDLANYKDALKSYELREKYAPLFQVEREDMEWLPDPPAITATIPEKQELSDDPLPELKGWPYYEKGTSYAAGHQTALGNYRRNVDLGNGIILHLIKVPAGQFLMGSNRHADEKPISIQKVEKPFWIGQFEITNEQYACFDPSHDSRTEHRHGYQFGQIGYALNKPRQPVVRISWNEAMQFCSWLSNKTGLNVSLPTEAQWEWACRAGSGRAYSFGDLGSDYSLHANMGDRRLQEFAACTSYKNYESIRILDNPSRYDDWVPRDDNYDDGGFVSEEVGRYRPNSWDLYDMHGNVAEWTLSAYSPYPYNDKDGRNDTASSDLDAKRVVRGGSWYDRPFKNTSTFRIPYRPYQKVFNVGFRIVVNE